MAPVIDSQRTDGPDLALRWSGQISLTRRILAVNIIALLMLAGGFFYLDSYRSRIVDSRVAQAGREARLIGEAVAIVGGEQRTALVLRLAEDTGARLRLFDPAGHTLLDSRALGLRNLVLADPDKQAWDQTAARFLEIAGDDAKADVDFGSAGLKRLSLRHAPLEKL